MRADTIRSLKKEIKLDKNTIIAIVLSTIVVVASFLLQPILFPQLSQKSQAAETTTTEVQAEENTVADLSQSLQASEEASIMAEANASAGETFAEEKVTISTDMAEIVLTSKGGDIISYKLKNHLDTDTKEGVQLSDSITETNRTLALSFGGVESSIINENFKVTKVDANTVLFTKNFVVNGKTVTLGKRYTFKDGENVFKLDILLHSDGDLSVLTKNGAAYTLRTSPQIGPHFDQKLNRYEYREYITYNDKKAKKTRLSNGQFKKYDKDFTWSAIAGKYFTEIVAPSNPDIISAGYYSSSVEIDNYANAQAFTERKAISGSDVEDTYYVYFGPRNEKDLLRYNVSDNNGWGIANKRFNDVSNAGMLSWLEKILKYILQLVQKVVKNWGVAIIVVTLLLRIVLYPISKKQSMSTLKMQEVQPRMQKIQEKYADNKPKQQEELAKLYKETGYNPAGGCLPMVFQFLIIFAMYNLFNNYFEFRGASFIPGWIPDLSVGDSVYTFKFTIPLLGWNQLRLLPIIYTVSQLFFGKITQVGGAGQSNSTMKFMTYGMPLMFFFLFYNAPSGLLLYWTVSNLFQMGQQLITNKMMKNKKAGTSVATAETEKKLPPKAKKGKK